MHTTVPAGLTRKQAELFAKLDPERLPKHIAVIMDGNGRWARRRHLPRIAGHKRGVDAVRDVITLGSNIHLSAMTLYAFSAENWKRPKTETSFLMALAADLPEARSSADEREQHPASLHRAHSRTASRGAGADGLGDRTDLEEHRHDHDPGAELRRASGVDRRLSVDCASGGQQWRAGRFEDRRRAWFPATCMLRICRTRTW